MLHPVRRFAFTALLASILVSAGPLAAPAAAGEEDLPEIPFTKKVLGNGLTVIVHEDHKAPVVGVMVWYHVGSKDEKPGRTGFAHLFEHLMFNGSEHADDDWFRAVGAFGATGVNGTTNNDRTNYFETVPAGALDATLWLESDRMGHLVGAIDQAKVDEQRGVVQNEKRQGENEPYGSIWRMLPALCYPPGHPYSWPVIGSMEDLDAARLDDVKGWFRAYYGAANAVVVVAGDVDTAEALGKVEHYFGDIPPGPPVVHVEAAVAKRTGTTRVSVQERVPQARVHKVWNTPEWGARDSRLLNLAASVLARGEGSRLHDRLVRREGIATETVAFQDESEIASQFHVWATVADGVDPARVEAILDEEMARFLRDGPTADELATEKAQVKAEFLRRLERVGGFGGKSDLLASSEVFGGSPDAWKDEQRAIAAAAPAEVRDAAARWLSDGALVVETRPFPRVAAAKEGADRSAMPAVGEAGEARFPALQRAELPNGVKVVLARREGLPLVRMDLLVDAGFAADPAEAPGTAHLVGEMLTAGTAGKDALALRRAVDRLGGELTVETGADATRITLSTLSGSLPASISLLSEIALRPSFPAEELETRRRGQLAAISQEKVDGRGMVGRVLPRILYGAGHPYGAPSSGTGTEEAVAKMTREDLARFHGAWFRPGAATLVVTGNTDMADLMASLAKEFGAWEPGTAPAKALPVPPPAGKSRVLLLDRPGAPQSVIVGAALVPARGGPEEIPLEVMNTILGGSFVSRLNMNLREDKHWSYGARSMLRSTRGPRALMAMASVQTDRTAESLAEMVKEMKGIAGAVPPTEKEMAEAKSSLTLTLPGRWESTRNLSESLQDLVTFGLPDGWYDGYAARIRAVTAADLAAAGSLVDPDAVVWVVIGDRAKVEAPLRAMALPVEVVE